MWRNRLYPRTLLASRSCKTNVFVGESTLQHERAGIEMSASGNAQKKCGAGSYYRWLAYTDLRRELQSKKQYGEEYMKVTAQSSGRWAVALGRKASDRKGHRRFI